MKKFIVVIIVIGFTWIAQVSHAKILNNTDPNMLWLEDGVDVETDAMSMHGWNATQLEIRSVPGKGIIFRSPAPDKYGSGRYLPVDPEYPYMVWEIPEVKATGAAYRGINVSFHFQNPKVPSLKLLGFEGPVYPGIYVTNLALFNPQLTKENTLCVFYLYGTEMLVKTIKMVKVPDYYIEITSPAVKEKNRIEIGDTITFRVIMCEPAEDVTLAFYDSRPSPSACSPTTLNGQGRLQLKPENGNQKIWTGSMDIKTAPSGDFPPATFIIRADILGAGINLPLWSTNSYLFHFPK